jgi:nicotinamidase-related amidase
MNTESNDSARALIVIDVQEGFDDPIWGPRDNLDCERNVRELVEAFGRTGEPIVLVRHDSSSPSSPLRRGLAGNDFKPILDDVVPALVVPKRVHSAFHGELDLDGWLRSEGIRTLVICGIQTNRCCETTARIAGNIGYDVRFVLDAMHTFDEPTHDGAEALPAELLARVTAANLDPHFARVVKTEDIL